MPPRKRKPIKKPPKSGQLIPLREERWPWYHAPWRVVTNGVAGLLGIFRRPKKQPPRAARRRRKK